MRRLLSAVTGAAVTVVMLTGCGIRIPSDPDGTLDAVEGGVLRAGVSPNGDWVRVDEDEPTGVEVDALTTFARTLDAEIEWTVGSEESLVHGLEEGDLDVVAGGITEKTPWTKKAGMTRPYAEASLPDGSTVKLVMLVPLGENAFVSRLESFLVDDAESRGIAP